MIESRQPSEGDFPRVEASYTPLWRWGLPLGLYFFVGLGGYVLYLVIVSSGPVTARVFLLPVSALFFYLAFVGLRLMPFCDARITADDDGLRVTSHRGDRHYQWQEVSRAIDHPNLQILDVFSADGSRILSVDYYLTNFHRLRRIIMENLAAKG